MDSAYGFGGVTCELTVCSVYGQFFLFQTNTWGYVYPCTPPCLPGQSPPPPRAGAAMSYDPQEGADILFGGYSPGPGGGTYNNQTWALFLNGSWFEQHPPNSPPPLANASMIYDPALGGLLLFGGDNGSALSGQTWEYARGDWAEISGSALGNPPSPRTQAAFAFDNETGEGVLFGGLGPSGPQGGTFLFSSSTGWTRDQVSGGPSSRFGAGMVSNGNGTVLLFGGRNVTSLFSQTWIYVSGGWSMSSATGPAARWDAALVYVNPQGEGFPVLFGGWGEGRALNDSWKYGPLPVAPPPPPVPWEAYGFGGLLGAALLLGGVILWRRRSRRPFQGREGYGPGGGTSRTAGPGWASCEGFPAPPPTHRQPFRPSFPPS